MDDNLTITPRLIYWIRNQVPSPGPVNEVLKSTEQKHTHCMLSVRASFICYLCIGSLLTADAGAGVASP